ncbi:MAG: hypothetical protein F4X93_05725 [Proteobacteria bacterium]|nr:hypothetical protein [Pseudomonadota bacterium]
MSTLARERFSAPSSPRSTRSISSKSERRSRDVLRFIHITDTHLLDGADDTFHRINTKQSLQAVLAHCAARYPDADFWLFTGDISQTGAQKSYAQFESAIREYDVPVYCVPGNHDTPQLLQQVAPECPLDSIRVISLGRFSLVLISTWIANEHHGKISQRCLTQLREHLQNSKDQLNVVVLHHPPVPVNSKWLDEIALQNNTDFVQILDNHPGEVLVLFGHVHQSFDQQLNQLRFLSTPSTCHQFKPNAPVHLPDPLPPAYRFVELDTNGCINTRIHHIQ